MLSLAVTNKHLTSARKRREAVRLTVATSSAIEGISAPFRAKDLAVKETAKDAKKSAGARRVKPSGHAKTG